MADLPETFAELKSRSGTWVEELVDAEDKIGNLRSDRLGEDAGGLRTAVGRLRRLGVFWLLLAVGCFSLAVALALAAWLGHKERTSELRREIQKLLERQQEPGRDDRYPTLVAAALQLVEKVEQEGPDDHTGDGAGTPSATARTLLSRLRAMPSDAQPGDQWRIRRCALAGRRGLTFGLPPGVCLERSGRSIYIPPTEVCDGLQVDAEQSVAEWLSAIDSTCLSRRVRDGVQYAAWFMSDANDFVEEQLGPTIPQMYFISPDGLLGHMAADRSALEIIERRPLMRLEARSYFQAFLDGRSNQPPDLSETMTYLDVTGQGFVRTICQSVRESGKVVTRGILCTDVTMMPSIIERALEQPERPPEGHTELFSYRIFAVEHAPAGGFVSNRQNHSGLRLPSDADLAAAKRSPRVLRTGGFLINVTSTERATGFMLLEPARGSDAQDWWLALSLFFFLLSMALLVVTARLTAAARENFGRGAILRNLQVGVVELDEKSGILFANDRAEEVIGHRLRHFGEHPPGESPLRFNELFDTTLLVRVPREKDEPVAEITMADIDRARARGETSRYFCRGIVGPQEGRWFDVTGSPVLRSRPTRRRAGKVATFGLVDEVPRGLVEVLEAYYKNRKDEVKWKMLTDRMYWWLRRHTLAEES